MECRRTRLGQRKGTMRSARSIQRWRRVSEAWVGERSSRCLPITDNRRKARRSKSRESEMGPKRCTEEAPEYSLGARIRPGPCADTTASAFSTWCEHSTSSSITKHGKCAPHEQRIKRVRKKTVLLECTENEITNRFCTY
jgi:hypothetical protein